MANPIRVLIVDDEPLARRGLEIRLRDAADLEIVGQCSHGAEAVQMVDSLRPDLMFLDVQMPGMDGFATLQAIPADSRPLVVFVTAFDHHAVRAFEACALDYLLKPVDEARLAQSLDRVREALVERGADAQRDRLLALLRQVSGQPDLKLDEIMEQGDARLRERETLAIKDGHKTVRVSASTIRWIEAAGDYMCVYTDGDTHILRATMRDMEQQLDPRHFQRIHRSTIVNLRRVKSMRPHINGEYFLALDSGHEVKLSRSYRDKLEMLR